VERNVTVPAAKTMSYLGARVNDITKLLPNVLRRDIELISIIVHVGFNDMMKGSSEQFKLDVKELIDSLLDTNRRPIISDPVPSLNRGIEPF
jgi:hypothetical protein